MNASLKHKALTLLTRRSHSEHELRQKLMQFCYKQDLLSTSENTLSEVDDDSSKELQWQQEIDSVIDYCYHYHWLNDLDFTCEYIRIRSQKGFGARRLRMELKQKGVSAEIVEQAFQKISIDESQLIRQIIKKKFGEVDSKDRIRQRKIYNHLISKGFGFDAIRDVLNNALFEG